MHREALDLLRCPYCGGRLALDRDHFVHETADEIIDGVVRCFCSEFPIVSTIGVLTVEGMAEIAREQIEAEDPDAARRSMFGLDDDAAAARFDDLCRAGSGTYRAAVEALGPEFAENRYFLYRFSDPTFLVADAVVQALARRLLDGGRAVDLCGGSGHLTRSLQQASSAPPILMDWTFVKLWLARSFTCPGAEFVCADAHAPLPFAPGAFRVAVCSDAFHYIWSKALLGREMLRVIDGRGVAAITHAHNAKQENPSAGMPLPPKGYLSVFEGADARLFSERTLLADVIAGHLDLSRRHEAASLDADPALTAIAASRSDVFADYDLGPSSLAESDQKRTRPGAALRLNPLYEVSRAADRATLRLRFPSDEYAREYAACLAYLPETLTIDAAVVDAIEQGRPHAQLRDLAARRIILALPDRYL